MTLFLFVAATWGAFEIADRHYPPPLARAADVSTEITARDGRLLRAFTNSAGRWRLRTNLDDIDPRFIELLVAYEDKRFWHHGGIDLRALTRAVWQLISTGHIVSGGSTITMQLARLLEPPINRRSLGAKFRQIWRALQIERRLGKREILAHYLTLAPYGGNLEGIRAAALAWLGHGPEHLPPADAALLVALPQAPEGRRPDRHHQRTRQARDRVLARGVRMGVLSPAEQQAARRREAPQQRRPMPIHAAHLAERLHRSQPERRLLSTTIDYDLQQRLEALAQQRAKSSDNRLTLALLAVEHSSAEILAHVGAPDYFDTGRQGMIDRTRAIRSPGSTLKPFIYGLAFETGLVHPETLIEDRPTDFSGYAPRNFDSRYRGTVTVREALTQSLNVPAVELLEAVGPSRLLARLRRAGVTPQLPPGGTSGLAIGLGGVGLSLTDLVTLYAALARGGEPIPLHEILDHGVDTASSDPLLEPLAGAYVRDILQDTPPPEAARGGDIAYKTGTSYGYRDAWAIGFDGRHVIGVWTGGAESMTVPRISGRNNAAPVLFNAFARIGKARTPLPPLPGNARVAATGDLPAPLRHFQNPHHHTTPAGTAPLAITFPPPGARLERPTVDNSTESPLMLKAAGGVLPLTWFANGRPVNISSRRRIGQWTPDGPGFSTLTVIDALGQAARVEVYLEQAISLR
ncbi:MAG: penicillin-binding protein 1C [Sulfitobacter sp.]|nr:penicillin-binding protein 1C [Sulfitobacter sp.]